MDEYETTSGVCPCCNQPTDTLANRRRITNYPNEDSNWLLSCKECFTEDCDYFSELIAEYYAGLI